MPAPSLRRHTSAFWEPDWSQSLQYEPQTLPSYSPFGTQGGALWIYSHPIGQGEPLSSEPSRTSWNPMSGTPEAAPDSQHSTTSPQGVLCRPRRPHIGNVQFLPHLPLAEPVWKALVDEHFESRNILKADSSFIHQLLPNNKLPVDIVNHRQQLSEILHGRGYWSRKSDHLRVPNLADKIEVQKWISILIEALDKIAAAHPSPNGQNGSQLRTFYLNCDNAPPSGYYIDRRPDIILTENKERGEATYRSWFAIRGLIEYTGDYRATTRLKETQSAKTYILHATQSHRRFSISVALRYVDKDCAPHFHMVYADRTGAVQTADLAIETQGSHNSLTFLRIFAFLFYGLPEDIGFDPTMSVNEATGEVNFVKFGDRQYDVQQTLFLKPSLTGRATKVWRTTCENVTYVVKDSWVDEHRRGVECNFLKDIKAYCAKKGLDMEEVNLPEIYDGGAVMIGDQEDSTQRLRGTYGIARYMRLHERLVLETFGDDLSTFRSSKELFEVLAGAVSGHKFLCDMNILHRDISAKNILICRTGNKVRGILIDLDCAVSMSPDSQKIKFQESRPSGTPPFMALALLWAEKAILHEPKHDLESFVYVLMYMVSAVTAPSKSFEIRSGLPIRKWFSNTNLAEIFLIKNVHLLFLDHYFLKFLSAYWKPFHRSFVLLCRHAYTPILSKSDGVEGVPAATTLGNTLTHENLTNILRDCRDTMPGNPDGNPDADDNDHTESDSGSDSDDDRDRNHATGGKRKCPHSTKSRPKRNRVDVDLFKKAQPMSVSGAPWPALMAVPGPRRRALNRWDSEFTADFTPVAMSSGGGNPASPTSTSPTFASPTSSPASNHPFIVHQFVYSNRMEQGPSTSNYMEQGPSTSIYMEQGPSTSNYTNQGPSTR